MQAPLTNSQERENQKFWQKLWDSDFVKDEIHYSSIEIEGAEQLIDNNESITPTTDKGYLDIDKLQEALNCLKQEETHDAKKDMVPEEATGQTVSDEPQEETSAFDEDQDKIDPAIKASAVKLPDTEVLKQQSFVKKYQYQENEFSQVLRFGINTDNEELSSEVEGYNAKVRCVIKEDLELYLEQPLIKSILNNIKDTSDFDSNDAVVEKYAKQLKVKGSRKSEENKAKKAFKLFLDTHNFEELDEMAKMSKMSTESVVEDSEDTASLMSIANTEGHIGTAKTIAHTGIEESLMSFGCQYLRSDASRVVLLDILERDLNTTIIGNVQNTHTVVLYKDINEHILVIDPSNPQFSSHLANFSTEDIQIETSYSAKDKLYIRSNASETGFDQTKYRDCVDIAVKIAFALNADMTKYTSIKDILKADSVKQISNVFKINDSIPDQIQEDGAVSIPLRIQQKSNLKISEDLYKFSKALKINLTDIKDKDKLEEQYLDTLRQSDSIQEIFTLKNLFTIASESFVILHDQLEEREVSELGKTFDSTNYGE